MLYHVAIGPNKQGEYVAGYWTPGYPVLTPVTVCRTSEQAHAEADRLNGLQAQRESAIQFDRRLCGSGANS